MSLLLEPSAPTVQAMTNDEGWRRYIEAGMALTQITRARAEELVRELVRNGEMERGRAQERVDELVRRSRERSEALLDMVRDEVQSQLRDLGMATVEDVAARVADLIAAAAKAGRTATGQAGRAGGSEEKAPARKAAAKRAPAKRAATKAAAPARKAAAKKAPAKRAATKAAAPARKAAAKKAPAKRTATKKAAAGSPRPSQASTARSAVNVPVGRAGAASRRVSAPGRHRIG